MNKCCGTCMWLERDEGEPFYCLISDLYTFREETDRACEWYEHRNDVEVKK